MLFHSVWAWPRLFAIKSDGVPSMVAHGCVIHMLPGKNRSSRGHGFQLSQRDDVVAGWCAGVKQGASR